MSKYQINAYSSYLVGELLTIKKFMLSLDGIVVSSNIKDFFSGMSMLFGSFYIFGVEFVDKNASVTLEFNLRYELHVSLLTGLEKVDI